MPSNAAAYIVKDGKGIPLEVRSAPYTSPNKNEIVVKNGAVAINPVDYLKGEMGSLIMAWMKYPFIMGSDVAGEVVEIGSAVTRFQVGDRVVGMAIATDEKVNNSAYSGFQKYTVIPDHMASGIPSRLSYESASVIPLGASTAACGLFQKDQLNLQYPSTSPKPTGQTIMIWGGSTSVGCNAIQLAVAAGYEVITTCSPRNFDLVQKLGASKAFDYNSKTIVDDLIHACKGKQLAGTLSIGAGGVEASRDILGKCEGEKFISMANYPSLKTEPKHFAFAQMAFNFVSWSVVHFITCKRRGIRAKFIWGTDLIHNGVGKAVYADFLPEALANGTYIAAPEPLVVGKGLEYIQTGCGLQKKGVSARKVVVSL